MLVSDIENPVVSCPADITQDTDPGVDNAVVSWTISATDNSGTATLILESHTSGSPFPIGNTAVSYTFTDPSSNNGLCGFTITINGKNSCTSYKR